MSDFWLGVLVSALVAGILVPLFNHYLAKRREHKSTVRINIRANLFTFPTCLDPALQSPPTFGGAVTQPLAQPDQMNVFRRIKAYLRITLENNSNKKLTGVIFLIKPPYVYDMLFQRDGQKELLGPLVKQIDIGTVLPGHPVVLHAWSAVEIVDVRTSFFPETFNVTADEIKDISFRYPLSGYLVSQYLPLHRKLLGLLRKLRFLPK